MKHTRWMKLSAAVAIVSLLPRMVESQTVTSVAGTPFNAPTLTGFATSGAQMSGMEVRWTFANATSGFGLWGSLGGGAHGVSSGGFSLSFPSSGDSFNDIWTVNNTSGLALSSIRLNGAPGRTVFDILSSATGTDGSALGRAITTNGGGYTGGVSAQYANSIGLNGAPPVGDLFEQLTISFTNSYASGTYLFRADTDNSSFDAPPPTTAVPEPSAYALLSAGLVALGVIRRRRRA